MSESRIHKNIVVPVDFSAPSKHGLEYALGLAPAMHARLTLVHVMEYHPAYHEMALGADWYTPDAIEKVREHLDELARSYCGGKVPYLTEVLMEPTTEEAIVEFARERGADLIVMGTHARTGLSRVLMGSTARHVVRHASCPVITVGPKPGAAAA